MKVMSCQLHPISSLSFINMVTIDVTVFSHISFLSSICSAMIYSVVGLYSSLIQM